MWGCFIISYLNDYYYNDWFVFGFVSYFHVYDVVVPMAIVYDMPLLVMVFKSCYICNGAVVVLVVVVSWLRLLLFSGIVVV